MGVCCAEKKSSPLNMNRFKVLQDSDLPPPPGILHERKTSSPLNMISARLGLGGSHFHSFVEEENSDAVDGIALEMEISFENVDAAVRASAASAPPRPARLHEAQRDTIDEMARLHAQSARSAALEVKRLQAELKASHQAERQGLSDVKTLMARIRVLEAGSPKRGTFGASAVSIGAADAQVPSLPAEALLFLGDRQQARNEAMAALNEKLEAEQHAIQQGGSSAGVGGNASVAERVRRAKILSAKLEVLEGEFAAALNVERVNRLTMVVSMATGVEARARYASGMVEQRIDALGAIARALKRARLVAAAAEAGRS